MTVTGKPLAGMAGFVLFLNILGWGTLIGIVAPQNLAIGSSGIFGIGLGMVAPTINDHAQPEVKAELLPRLWRGDIIANRAEVCARPQRRAGVRHV